MMLVWTGHEHFTLLLVLYCDSDSGIHKWVTCALLPFTLPFCKGAWELGPDCGSDLNGELLILQVTMSSMLLIAVFYVFQSYVTTVVFLQQAK